MKPTSRYTHCTNSIYTAMKFPKHPHNRSYLMIARKSTRRHPRRRPSTKFNQVNRDSLCPSRLRSNKRTLARLRKGLLKMNGERKNGRRGGGFRYLHPHQFTMTLEGGKGWPRQPPQPPPLDLCVN